MMNRVVASLRSSAFSVVSAGVMALAAFVAPASAQIQIENLADGHLLQPWVAHSGNRIRFCHYEDAETQALDRAIGAAIADRLLLESTFSTLRSGFGIGGEFADEDLFIAMTNSCDVLIGVGLAAGAFTPDYTVTRPYVGYDYPLIAHDPAIARLDDVPTDGWLGAQINSYGDFLLRQYLAARPAAETWRRLVYGDANLMLDRLVDGTLGAAIIFGPTLLRLTGERADGEAFHILEDVPALRAEVNIGGALFARNTFLRTQIDAAITDMVEDGTIADLIVETGFDRILTVPGGY